MNAKDAKDANENKFHFIEDVKRNDYQMLRPKS